MQSPKITLVWRDYDNAPFVSGRLRAPNYNIIQNEIKATYISVDFSEKTFLVAKRFFPYPELAFPALKAKIEQIKEREKRFERLLGAKKIKSPVLLRKLIEPDRLSLIYFSSSIIKYSEKVIKLEPELREQFLEYLRGKVRETFFQLNGRFPACCGNEFQKYERSLILTAIKVIKRQKERRIWHNVKLRFNQIAEDISMSDGNREGIILRELSNALDLIEANIVEYNENLTRITEIFDSSDSYDIMQNSRLLEVTKQTILGLISDDYQKYKEELMNILKLINEEEVEVGPEILPMSISAFFEEKLINLPEIKNYTRLCYDYYRNKYKLIDSNSPLMLRLHEDLTTLEETIVDKIAGNNDFVSNEIHQHMDRMRRQVEEKIENESKVPPEDSPASDAPLEDAPSDDSQEIPAPDAPLEDAAPPAPPEDSTDSDAPLEDESQENMLEEEVETEPEIPPDDSPASDAQRTLDDPEDKPIPKEDIVRKKLENLPEMKKYTRLYHKYCKGVFNSIGTNSFAMLQLHTDLSILEDTTNRELAECFHPFFMFVVYSCIDRYICDLRRQIETEEKEIYLNYYREKIKSPTIVRNLAITEIVLGILGGAAIAVLALEKLINIRSIFFMSLSGICALFLITGVLVAAVSTAIIKKRKNVQEQNLGVIKTVDNCIYFD